MRRSPPMRKLPESAADRCFALPVLVCDPVVFVIFGSLPRSTPLLFPVGCTRGVSGSDDLPFSIGAIERARIILPTRRHSPHGGVDACWVPRRGGPTRPGFSLPLRSIF